MQSSLLSEGYLIEITGTPNLSYLFDVFDGLTDIWEGRGLENTKPTRAYGGISDNQISEMMDHPTDLSWFLKNLPNDIKESIATAYSLRLPDHGRALFFANMEEELLGGMTLKTFLGSDSEYGQSNIAQYTNPTLSINLNGPFTALTLIEWAVKYGNIRREQVQDTIYQILDLLRQEDQILAITLSPIFLYYSEAGVKTDLSSLSDRLQNAYARRYRQRCQFNTTIFEVIKRHQPPNVKILDLRSVFGLGINSYNDVNFEIWRNIDTKLNEILVETSIFAGYML